MSEEKTKINYYKVSLKEIENLKGTEKPRLLLHACCGPCACWPLRFLSEHFRVTIYFNNSNIYPSNEYDRRLEELKKLLGYLKKDYGYDVDLVVTPYENEQYNRFLAPHKDDPEGGERCKLCYEKRMKEAYCYAQKEGFDYFTTVMTISRQKDSQVMNEIGAKLEPLFPNTKYFYSDFKKAKGIEIGKEMRIHYGLYNQNYCGCIYSYLKRLEWDESHPKSESQSKSASNQ